MGLLQSITSCFRGEREPDAERLLRINIQFQRQIMADLAELKEDVSEAVENTHKLVTAFKDVLAAEEEQKKLISELKEKLEAGTIGQADIDELDAKIDEVNAIIKDALPVAEATEQAVEQLAATDTDSEPTSE